MNSLRLLRVAAMSTGLTALAAGASIAATAPAPATAAPAPATAAVAKPTTATHAHATAKRKAAAPKGFVEPGALAALARMDSFLRANRSFAVKMSTARDEVDDFGQLLTFAGETTYNVKLPSDFTVDVADDTKVRRYVYDGKQLTIYDPATGFYARFNAPPTIRATLDLAASKYGFTFPLEDLFDWGEGQDNLKKLTSGHFVRTSKIDGQDADQYAFRQPGVDWQIWIAKGVQAAPLRVVIVAGSDPARPRFETNLSWDTSPQFTAETFVFTPPPNAKQIQIATG
ncbi:MAG TPA: DUF2092 domain-containing protein, partial [Caulobacteraceae bacterium]